MLCITYGAKQVTCFNADDFCVIGDLNKETESWDVSITVPSTQESMKLCALKTYQTASKLTVDIARVIMYALIRKEEEVQLSDSMWTETDSL